MFRPDSAECTVLSLTETAGHMALEMNGVVVRSWFVAHADPASPMYRRDALTQLCKLEAAVRKAGRDLRMFISIGPQIAA